MTRRLLAGACRAGLAAAASIAATAALALGGAPAARAAVALPAAAATSFPVTVGADDASDAVTISGRAVYYDTPTATTNPANSVQLQLATASGDPLPSSCGVPSKLEVHRPRSAGDATGTALDGDGYYRFSLPLRCEGKFTATVTAWAQYTTLYLVPSTAGSAPNSVQFEHTLPEPPSSPPPSTPGSTPSSTPGSAPGSVTPPGGSVPPSSTPSGSQGGSLGHGDGIGAGRRSPNAAIPSVPGISGSRVQPVRPGSSGTTDSATPDTYSPTLQYPGQSGGQAIGQQRSKLAGTVAAPGGGGLNMRVVAGTAAGALVSGLLAAQVVVLNRRGRELEQSLPRVR